MNCKSLLLLILFTALWGCKKDDDFNQNHKQLKRIIFSDNKTEIGRREFLYDHIGRLISSNFIYTDKKYPEPSPSNYTYDDNSNLLNIEDKLSFGTPSYYFTKIQLYYNQDKTIKSTREAVWYNGNLNEINEYIYTLKNNKVSEVRKKYVLLGIDNHTIKFTYEGNNISKIENLPSVGYVLEYTYGTAKNPYLYSRVSNYPIPKMVLESLAEYYSENEIKSEVYANPGIGMKSITNYEYKYDKSGYPISGKRTTNYYSSGEVTRTETRFMEYQYK